MNTVENRLRSFRDVLEPELDRVLEDPRVPDRLREAMRYAVLDGGKRLRPALVEAVCELVGGSRQDAMPGAIAVELIHVYSLVHDDLPCMDDDDLRRGRPTVHKVFGDAIAVLVGDALQALAVQVLLGTAEERRGRAAAILADAAGAAGMVGGQVLDLLAEGQAPDLDLVASIHRLKTAALIGASVEIGAVLGGAQRPVQARLAEYGRSLGLEFQIVDDCLDETATAEELGKSAGKDRAAGKMTFPACLGRTASTGVPARRCGKAAPVP